MRIAIIVAQTDDRVIGIKNRLPWNLPADMQWFRQHTLGKPVIMGRLTYESIGKPLPKRINVVVTRDKAYQAEGCTVVGSIDEALQAVADAKEAMIIGGASFYEQMLPRADRLYLTWVHADIDGDAWFPPIDRSEWQTIERQERTVDEKNQYALTFEVLERA